MGTTESLPSTADDEGENDSGGPPLAPQPPRTPSVAAARTHRGGLGTSSPSASSVPRPRRPDDGRRAVGLRNMPPTAGAQAPSSGTSPSNKNRSATTVVTCRLSGLVLGMDGSGKRTLLQRLQGRDPFFVGNRSQQFDDDNKSYHSSKDEDSERTGGGSSGGGGGRRRQGADEPGAAVVVVPYRTTHPVLHDRITLSVRTAVEAAKSHGGGGGAVDFAVLLLHPGADPSAAELYVKECVQQFLRRQGYKPNDESADNESPFRTADGGDSGNASAAHLTQGSSSSPPVPQPRPACLCLLLNFRDLKPPKYNGKNKSKSKKKVTEQLQSSDAAETPAPAASSWLSRSTVQQWVLEVLQGFDQRLDPTQMVLQIGHTSLYNCYGLDTLHTFVYHSYLVRQQHDAMRRLNLVQSLLRNVPNLHDNAESTSYEAFLESTKARAKQPSDGGDGSSHDEISSRPTSLKQQQRAATASNEDNQQPQQLVDDPSTTPHGPRRSVVLPSNPRTASKLEDKTAAATTTMPIAEPAPSRVDPVEASRAALEAFLMEDDSDGDDHGATLNQKTRQRGAHDGERGIDGSGDEDDDDDDDFFVEEVPAPAASMSTKLAPRVSATPPEGAEPHGRNGRTAGGSDDASRESDAERVHASFVEGEEVKASPPARSTNTSPSAAECEAGLVTPTNEASSPIVAVTAGSFDETKNADDSDSTISDPKLLPDTMGGPNQEVTVAKGDQARRLQTTSVTADLNTTTGSTASLPSANCPPTHSDDDDNDDDEAFIIEDTTTPYSPSKTTEATDLAQSKPSATTKTSVAPSSTLSAAALAAIAQAQLDAERMLGTQYAHASADDKKAKPKKEKKRKKEKKGSRKDGLHD